MTELSQLVRQRLASAESARLHPDPDLLTAYAEQLLAAPDRTQVLEHLAVCSQCREVMALSLEQPVGTEDATVMAAPASGRSRRFWAPAFGLGASLAAMAIVTTMIIELPRSQQPFKQERAAAPASSAGANTPSAMTPPSESAAETKTAKPADTDLSTRRAADTVAGRPVALAGKEPAAVPSLAAATVTAPPAREAAKAGNEPRRDYVNVQMFAAADAASAETTGAQPREAPAAPAPRPATNPFQTAPLSTNLQLQSFADLPPPPQSKQTVRSLPPPPGHFGFFGLTALGHKAEQLIPKRSTAIATGALTFSAMGGKGQLTPPKDQSQELAAAPLLEKDQSAELDHSYAFSTRAMASARKAEAAGAEEREKAGAQHSWKVADGKLLKSADSGAWAEGYSNGEGIQFSVVSAHGASVWAGGAPAALVHSLDGGASWERVTLGASATGTIVSISASGLNVRVKSSSGQSWSSQDGGRTWLLED